MGNTYTIQIAPAAERQIKKLTRQVQEKVVECLSELATTPRPRGVEKLSQDPRLWRVRVSEHRIIYWVDDNRLVVIALIVRHRKDAYRDIPKLDPAILTKKVLPLLANLSPAA